MTVLPEGVGLAFSSREYPIIIFHSGQTVKTALTINDEHPQASVLKRGQVQNLSFEN